MTLADLLRFKGNDIYKLKANACIADAATMLIDKKVGSLLVEDDDGRIVGIISERDVVGGLGSHGADLKDVPVSELMTTDIVHCDHHDTVIQAMAMMTDRRIRHLPVFDGDNLQGIISIGDLVKCRISEIQAEAEAMRQYITT